MARRQPDGGVRRQRKSDLARLAAPEAALAFVPYPFFVQHGAQLHLVPLAQADVPPAGVQQRWTLVLPKGHAAAARGTGRPDAHQHGGLRTGFCPRGPAQPRARCPPTTTITATGQVLSALRRAANGDPVAVLLDQEQAGATGQFAVRGEPAAVGTSAPVPVALIVVVAGRMPQARAQALQQALLHLSGTPQGAATLSRLRLNGFVTAAGLPPPRDHDRHAARRGAAQRVGAGRLRAAAHRHTAPPANGAAALPPAQLVAPCKADADRIDQLRIPPSAPGCSPTAPRMPSSAWPWRPATAPAITRGRRCWG